MKCPDCGCKFEDNRRLRLFSIGTTQDRHFFRANTSKCPRCGEVYIDEDDICEIMEKLEDESKVRLELVGDITK